MNIDESNVLITGAAGGIGSAIAECLVERRAGVLLADLRQEPLDRLACELARHGGRATTVAADLASDAGRAAVVAAARVARVDVLINAAGINPFGLFADQGEAEIGKTMLVNAVAPMLLCRALLPVLAARPTAHIVNVGSTFGSIGFPGFCTYSASKFALRGFSEALRRELADTSIRVHYVAPRATQTALATSRVRAMNDELGVGMDSPQVVAAAVVATLERERREAFLGASERLSVVLNGVLPGVVDRALRRQLPIIRRHATAGADAVPLATVPSSLTPRNQRS